MKKIWFSILVRKLLRSGSFTSKKALRIKIEQFIAYFNEAMAKPFRWTIEKIETQSRVLLAGTHRASIAMNI